ncbi:helix-turn-helix transcriptional regulator [Novosphingobium olei]|uniref:helix-turn-helix transcriptional regulator n=1 Tax=Novosphingobium olei TaxID=2728851 RepID=UPI001F1027CD|nr:helix-turn-helix transcriptional regulator [Novosphingobium olei]
MRTPVPGETDLLVPLHEGLFEQPMWQTFLSRLRAAAGVAQAAIVVMAASGEDVIEVRSGQGGEGFARFLTEGHADESARLQLMREARVYALEEIVAAGGPAQAGFAADVLRPAGIFDLRAVRLREPAGLDGWLILAGREELGAAQGRLLALVVPHFRAALRAFSALERERARAQISAEAFRRMNFGWITLDAACCVVDMDSQAESLLARTSAIRKGPRGRLLPASPEIDRALTSQVRALAADPAARPKALHLSRDPWIDLLVAPVRLHGLAGGNQPVAVAYISGDRSSSADRREQLVGLFGLSPSEARLAWAMAQGLGIAEAAAELGLTVETARNYSKKIYAKTGARGQADLVRHILTSVLALA